MNRMAQPNMHPMDTIFHEYYSSVSSSLFVTLSVFVDSDGAFMSNAINVGGIPDKKYYHGGIDSVISTMKDAIRYAALAKPVEIILNAEPTIVTEATTTSLITEATTTSLVTEAAVSEVTTTTTTPSPATTISVTESSTTSTQLTSAPKANPLTRGMMIGHLSKRRQL